MSILDEITSWDKHLRQELNGLKFCKQKISADLEIPTSIKNRLEKVIKSLKLGIIKVILKSEKLKEDYDKGTDIENKTRRLRGEYVQVLNNVDKLISTVDFRHMEPRYLNSTFNSRHRSTSPK